MLARRAIFACLILAFTAVTAMAQGAKDPVIARVNGQVLTRTDVELAYAALPPDVRQKVTIDKAYPQLLDELIPMLLLSQAAQKAKLDSEPVVKHQVFLSQAGILQDAYNNSILKKEVSKDKLQKAYDEYAKNAPNHEELHARHILVDSEKEANDIIAQLKKGTDFATLAKDKTLDPSGKASGGDLGWFSQDDMVPEFSAAAAKLKKGEFTQTPVHTQFGWHVIKLEDRRPGKALPYDQMAPRLAQQMAQQIVGKRVQELGKQAKIEVFALDGSKLPAAGGPATAASKQQAPKLLPPGGAAEPAPGTPTLSPETAPGKLKLQ